MSISEVSFNLSNNLSIEHLLPNNDKKYHISNLKYIYLLNKNHEILRQFSDILVFFDLEYFQKV